MRSLHKIGTAKIRKIYIFNKFINSGILASLCHDESGHCGSNEHEADDAGHDDADHLHSLEPGLAIPADGLEHAPETVEEVEPYSSEPSDVDDENYRAAEGLGKEKVKVR